MKTLARAVVIMLLSIPAVGYSHLDPPLIDKNGGHYDYVTGKYHCHTTKCKPKEGLRKNDPKVRGPEYWTPYLKIGDYVL